MNNVDRIIRDLEKTKKYLGSRDRHSENIKKLDEIILCYKLLPEYLTYLNTQKQ